MAKTYFYQGQELNQAALANALGIDRTTLWRQLKRGRTIEEIMEQPRHSITFNGESRSLKGWADLLGVHPATIIHRLQRGWTLEKTLTTK